VKYRHPEFAQIKQALISAPAPFENHRHLARRHHGKTEFIGLLEFVPGLSLEGPSAQSLLQRMTLVALQDFWRKTGGLLAMDALINNGDRLPLLWDNDGNTANVIVQFNDADDSMATVVGIDQAVVAILDHGPGLARYLERLAALSAPASEVTRPWSVTSPTSTTPAQQPPGHGASPRASIGFRRQCE